eukprot:4731232-Pleurochrysis_carterae.AAC.1
MDSTASGPLSKFYGTTFPPASKSILTVRARKPPHSLSSQLIKPSSAIALQARLARQLAELHNSDTKSKRIDASSPVKYDEIAGCSESDIVFRCLAPALVSTGIPTETSMPATKLHLKTIALALEEVERIIDHHDTSLCSLIQATRAALKAALRTLEAHKSKQNECNSQASTPESPQSSQGKSRLNHELAAQFENLFARGSREGLMKVDGRDSRRSEGASEAEASSEEQREVEDLTQVLLQRSPHSKSYFVRL